MGTSTSKKSNGYLKGYELACFTGQSRKVIARSLREQLLDECNIIFSDNDTAETVKEHINKVTVPLIDNFLIEFFRLMENRKSAKTVKILADSAKEDTKALERLMSILNQGKSLPVNCIAFAAMNGQYQISSTCDLSETCPYYIKSKFCIFTSRDDVEDLIGEAITLKNRCYKHLALALIKLASFLLNEKTGIFTTLTLYKASMLMNHILEAAKIYELMNPSGEVRQDQINTTLQLLQAEPLDHESASYKYWVTVYESVCADIVDGTKKYIQDIRQALYKTADFRMSKYDYDLDPYLSLKGTGQCKFTKKTISLVSSGYEIDVYRDEFSEFDQYVGFESYYQEYNPEIHGPKDEFVCVRTILIDNPGKFKGRIIHIFDNPIQDRANYVRRRVAAVTSLMVTDCTKDQDKGRRFVKDETLNWALEFDIENKIGIYNYDFSNATDTLDQLTQYKVLEFVMGPIIARFWDIVSKLPKFMQNVDGSMTRYYQKCGQPQGGLSSFDNFTLVHHFIFLMEMKCLGMEDTPAWKYYRVLGDDSTANSVGPEFLYYTPGEILDEAGISRSQIEDLHFKICREFAGFDINYDKSESCHYDSFEAKLDFAKVTYRNGTFYSPVPFRLGMRYSNSITDKLAAVIWRGHREDPDAQKAMRCVLKDIQDENLKYIVRSGLLDFLSPFTESGITFNPRWLFRVSYCIQCNLLEFNIGSASIKGHREMLSEDAYERAFAEILSSKEILELDNINSRHKLLNVVAKNEQIIRSLDQIYEFERLDDKFLAAMISPITKEFLSDDGFVKDLEELVRLSTIMQTIQDHPEMVGVYDSYIQSYSVGKDFGKKLEHFSNCFLTRSTTKRPHDEAVLLQKICRKMSELDKILGVECPVMDLEYSYCIQ